MNVKAQSMVRGLGSMACAAVASFALCPSLAFAADDEGAGIWAIVPDMAEFIPMLVAFIILWIVLAKWGWPLFNRMLERRENTIKDDLERAEQNRIESEKLLEEYKKQLEDAREQAAMIVAEAQSTAQTARATIAKEAQEESEAMIEKAHHAIELERRAAISELQSVVVDTSIDVASRLIKQDLGDKEHRDIIERYVNEAGSFNAN